MFVPTNTRTYYNPTCFLQKVRGNFLTKRLVEYLYKQKKVSQHDSKPATPHENIKRKGMTG